MNRNTTPPPVAFEAIQPGRLWSQWDMYKFNAQQFYVAVTALGRTREIIDTWKSSDGKPLDQSEVIKDGTCQKVLGTMNRFLVAASVLGASVTIMAAERLKNRLSETPQTLSFGELKSLLEEIDSRLSDELSMVTVFALDQSRSKHFNIDIKTFGDGVSETLSDAIQDIEDAGKCLALNQGTAAVFHAMRVMESALKKLAALLGIPYAPSWESYITQIEAKIAAKHKTKSVKWKQDEPFYREILGNLQTIKIAWRNPTMHIVRRYSPDEADEIFVAVRSFVRRLIPRLPKPKPPKESRAVLKP